MTDQGLETGTPGRRHPVRFGHAAAALIVLTCGETFAAPKPTLKVAVAPSQVTAGATGTTLTFTFTATGSASGTVFVTIPTSSAGAWSAPQTGNPNAAGYVWTNVGKCNSVGVPSVSGTWTVGVDWKCALNKSFTLVYRTTAAAGAGQHTFASQVTVGKQTLPLAPQPVVTVRPGAATSLGVTGPLSAVAGVAKTVTVTARDASANVATGYTGTVQFTSTDPGVDVELPGTYTFVANDNGVHVFTNDVTLTTVGSQNVTAVDTAQTSISGSATIAVTPGPAASLELSGIGNAVAGTQQSATVKAVDDFGNVATGYDGTVHFASSDPKAVLPGYPPDPFGGQPVQDYTFTPADAGTHTFANGVVLKTAISPNSVVDITDVDDPSLTSSQHPVILPGPAHNVTIGLPQTKDDYHAWSGFGVSQTFCGADASDVYGNRTPATLTWSSSDPAARLPPDHTLDPAEPFFLAQCNFATVGLQTVTVAVVNSTVKAADFVNVTHGPQANPDDVTLLDPAHVYGVTRWLLNVLVNDDQVKLDVFNPFLDFYNTIYSVEQATYSDNGTLYQVGLMSVSGDLHFVAWDLDPPADVEPTVPGAQMLRCPAPDELGTVSSICHITGPIAAGYTMTDGANYRSTDLTLHLETPDGPVTPLSHTQTAAPITISTDASRRATISVEPGVNVPVMQTILLGPPPTTTTGLIATTTSTSTSTPTTSSTSTSLIPAGAVQVNLNFNNNVTSTDGIGCAPGVNNCTLNIPTTASTALTAPTVGGLAIGGGNLVQGIVYAAQPQILRYNFAGACNVSTQALYDLYNTPANGGNCSVNSNCDTVVNKGDGVCTNGICTAGLVPPACSMNSDCDTAAGRNDGVCGATGRCTQGKVPTRCSNIPVVEGQVLPPHLVPVQMLLGSNPNNPAVQYSVLGIFNFITPLFDACKPDAVWKSYCTFTGYCTTGQDCGSGCCCDSTATCMEVATCNTDVSATCK